MDANKNFTGCKNVAVAEGCFDLPYAQAVDLCGTCHGQTTVEAYDGDGIEQSGKCVECEGLGFVQPRMITNWMFTPEEWQYMVDNPDKRGVFLSIIGVTHPKTLITVPNPIDMWPDVVAVDDPIAQDLLKRATANEG